MTERKADKLVRFAFATTDGETLATSHFGSADCYSIWESNGITFRHVRDIINTSVEEDEHEEHHGDVKKAASVMELLGNEKIHAVLAINFGPNIERIKKKFFPVFAHCEFVGEAMNDLLKIWNEIEPLALSPFSLRGDISIDLGNSSGSFRSPHAVVETSRCRGCSFCVDSCPENAISMRAFKAIVDETLCTGCGKCVNSCPPRAISVSHH
ncbi:MAG: 4Fe-4S binding protein [Deltaproteobacteria bacterium]|nr:4Fe-4S binding protein [Deltaproteobacteria bacterium]